MAKVMLESISGSRMKTISSRDNARLKHAQRVRDGKERGSIFVEGSRLVGEALRSEVAIDEAYFSETFLQKPEHRKLAEEVARRAGDAFEISDELAERLSDTKNGQGIFALARRPLSDFESFDRAAKTVATGLFAFLFEVNNPSNLGAIVRSGEAAGVSGVIVGENSVDPFSPKSLRASMGSAFRMPIWDRAPLDGALGWAKDRRMVTSAADTKGRQDYAAMAWLEQRLVVFGSEAHGLSPENLAKIDEVIRIPLENSVESLNLAVSAGVIFFEALRQRRSGHRSGAA